MTRARVPLHALLGVAAVASLGAPESLVSVPPRRRCACCRAPSNRCPCRVCGSCSTSGHAPEVAPCACGSKVDPAGGGERSPRGGSPDGLSVASPPPGPWDHPTQTNDIAADLRAACEQAERGEP